MRYDDPDLGIAWPLAGGHPQPAGPVRGLVARPDARRCPPLTATAAGAAGRRRGEVVLDLGDQPAADHFPPASDPGPDPRHPLAMWWCADCGLAQLLDDATVAEEPRAIEPRAAVRQAHEAVEELLGAGLLAPGEFVEFASPHGGSWGDGAAGRAASVRRRAREPASWSTSTG